METSQSAATAAGVPPPITKWKKRGPLDLGYGRERAVAVRRHRVRPAAYSVLRAGPRDVGGVDFGEVGARFGGGQLQDLLELRAVAERIAHMATLSAQ